MIYRASMLIKANGEKMKKYSYAQAPFLSFFSGDYYRYISNEKSGTGFFYLLLLLVFYVVPTVIKAANGFDGFVINEAPKIITQVPEITISNGQASIEEPQPYTIIDPGTNKPLVIIDTTGQVNSLQNTEARVLVTKSYVLYEKNAYETRTYDLSDVGNFIVNQSLINEWIAIAQDYFIVVLYPFMLIGLFIAYIIRMLIYAVIGMIFVKILKASNDYSSLLRLSVVAFTPVIIMQAIVEIVGLSIPASGVIFFLIAMMYLFFGVYSSKHAALE